MSSNTDITGLIKQIHESPLKLVIVSSGGEQMLLHLYLKFQEPLKQFLKAIFPMQENL